MNKETSLASQLRKLKTPQTNVFIETRLKASFLYDPKDAFTIDKDTHFGIAVNSFHAICQIDPDIQQFEKIFFSVASKEVDRGLFKPHKAEEMNQHVRQFLFKVITPYFLISHTHKMLEWLIFKFQIHDYNTDDLILSVMPYHETKLFARIVQLCAKIRQPTNQWHWLLEIQNQGVPLSKLKLIRHCCSHSIIIRTLIDNVITLAKQRCNIPILFSFITSMLITLIERDTNENLLIIVLYYLTKGFKSSNLSFITSSYMIFAHLSTKVTLKESKLEKLINKMCKYYSRSSIQPLIEKDFYLTLASVYKYQEITFMSDTTLATLDINETIELYKNIHFHHLMGSLLCKLISSCSNDEYHMDALKLLKSIEVNKSMIKNVLLAVSKISIDSDDMRQKLRQIISTLERRYPVQFDVAIQEINVVDFHDLLASSMYAKFDDTNANIWTALIHPNSKIRLLASIHIKKNMDSIISCESHVVHQMILSSLINTWNESSPAVLIELLSCKKLFVELVPKEDLFTYGRRLLTKCSEMILKSSKSKDLEDSNNWRTVQKKCLELIQDLDISDENFLHLYGRYLLALDDAHLEVLNYLLQSTVSSHGLHYNLKQDRKLSRYIADKNYGSIVDFLSSKIALYINSNSGYKLLDILSQPGLENFSQNIFCLCIIYHLLASAKGDNFNLVASKMIEIFSSLIKVAKLSSQTESDAISLKNVIDSSRSKLINSSLTIGLANFFLSCLIDLFTIKTEHDDWFWHRLESENHFLMNMFNFFCQQTVILNEPFCNIFKQLLTSFVKQIESRCPTFISTQWGCDNKPHTQARALSIGPAFISNYSPTDIDIILLLIAFRSKSFAIRELAAHLVQHLANKMKDKLLTILANQSELLKNDENKISFILADYEVQRNKQAKDWFKLIIDCILRDDIPISIQLNLIGLLNDYDLNKSFNIFIPVIQKLLKSTTLDSEICSILGLKLLKALNSKANLKSDDSLWLAFVNIMNNVHFRQLMLRHFTSQSVKEFSSNSMLIVCLFLDLMVETNDKAISKKVKKFLGDGALVTDIINSLTLTSVTENGRSTRKRRKTMKRTEFSIESANWKKVVIILDLVLTRESFFNSNQLVATLFDLLKESFISEEKSALEYFRYLLLNNISLCLNQEDFSFCDFDIHFIFEALRLSRQRETQRAALLIINRVSSHFKDEVLQNIMTIFSYIGDNMIKCDDQYTHKVLDDTMDVIIKNMAESEYTSQNKIIQIFIDAMDDIPAHRRLYLFHKLTSLLNEEESLWYIVLKLSENGIYNSKNQKQRLELSRALICKFKSGTQLITLERLIDCIDTIDQKGSINGRYNEIFFKEKDKSVIISLIIQVIQLVVSSDEFVISIADTQWSSLKEHFTVFLGSLLSLISKVSKKDSRRTSISSFKLTANDLFKILEKINHLLPFKELSNLLHELIKSNSSDVRRRSLDLLNSRLTSYHSVKLKASLLRSFIKPLQAFIEEVKENDAENVIINCQTALLSLKLISKLLKNDEKSINQFEIVLKSIISISESDHINPNFLASSLLCSTALAISLQKNSLIFIPSLSSIIIKNLTNRIDIVALSSVTALSKLIHYFHKFLSPCLNEILVKLCLLHCNNQSMDINLENKVSDCSKNIATLIQFRLLISSFDNAYDQLLTQDVKTLQLLFAIVKQSLSNSTQAVLEANLLDLQKFIIKVLDYRSKNQSIKNDKDIEMIEDICIEAIVTFVPKLSENSFRPFFYKVYDWSILSKEKNQQMRLITFYRLTNNLADTLKSLFCAFAAPYIINNCLQQLQLFNLYQQDGSKKAIDFNEEVGHLIVLNVLATLGKCFLYDINSSFSTNERVVKMISPIIDQLNNDFGSSEKYNERIEKGVISCAQNLAKAVSDYHLVKDLNYKILLKTRENSLKIRYQALRVLHHLILSATDEYLPLLPEAIPFLAELHEDDSDELQKLLLIVFNDIERIFGEPIASYF